MRGVAGWMAPVVLRKVQHNRTPSVQQTYNHQRGQSAFDLAVVLFAGGWYPPSPTGSHDDRCAGGWSGTLQPTMSISRARPTTAALCE